MNDDNMHRLKLKAWLWDNYNRLMTDTTAMDELRIKAEAYDELKRLAFVEEYGEIQMPIIRRFIDQVENRLRHSSTNAST